MPTSRPPKQLATERLILRPPSAQGAGGVLNARQQPQAPGSTPGEGARLQQRMAVVQKAVARAFEN